MPIRNQLLAAAIPLCMACGGSAGSGEDVVVRDSAGIQIVEIWAWMGPSGSERR